MEKIARERLERVARLYATSKDASHALGINPVSFCRLCRRYNIETPFARRRKKVPRAEID